MPPPQSVSAEASTDGPRARKAVYYCCSHGAERIPSVGECVVSRYCDRSWHQRARPVVPRTWLRLAGLRWHGPEICERLVATYPRSPPCACFFGLMVRKRSLIRWMVRFGCCVVDVTNGRGQSNCTGLKKGRRASLLSANNAVK